MRRDAGAHGRSGRARRKLGESSPRTGLASVDSIECEPPRRVGGDGTRRGRAMSMELGPIATGRGTSRFAADVASHSDAMHAAFARRRVLVIGGAGSIGAATVRALLPFDPAAVHVVDHDENGLAELIRDLRSSGRLPDAFDLRLEPLDYGSGGTRRVL